MTGRSSNNPAPGDRPPSPTEVASPDHPSGCTCGCWNSGFPKWMYRNFQGDSVFTGVLLVAPMENEDCLFKLNDPNYENFAVGDAFSIEDLAGHGHVMTDAEYVLEMRQYDANESTDSREVKNATSFLKDFADKPQDFEFKHHEIEQFSTTNTFPHGIPGLRWTIPQIRARDSVKVMVQKYVAQFGQTATERIWVDVLAVNTNAGMLVGTINSSIDNPFITCKNFPFDASPDPNFDLHEDDLVAFPITCVFGVIHKANW